MSALVVGLCLIGCARREAAVDAGIGDVDAGDPNGPAGPDAGGGPPDLEPPPPRMGGQLTPTGASFRVWAPDANGVTVTGDFDGWGTTHALTKTAGNVWVGDVDGAQAGQRYRYLVSQGGQTLTRSDPRARGLDDAAGKSVLVDTSYAWQSAPFASPDFDHQLIYELHIGTFNVRPGEPRGTYRSAIDRLDALAALGVNMIELLPIAEFPGDRSWGYNPAGSFAVESSYGTPDDFRALVDAAHARGIGVLLDVVHNHYDDTLLHCWDG
ncbi:MAG: alpha-amylase family glycosyl hydrolase, partial [Polyangia bacterium]